MTDSLGNKKPIRLDGLIVVLAGAHAGKCLLNRLALWWVGDSRQPFGQPTGKGFAGVSVSESNGNRHPWVGQ